MKSNKFLWKAAILGSFCFYASPMPVFAQQVAVLEEIIVTARKREENLLEVPESITKFFHQT